MLYPLLVSPAASGVLKIPKPSPAFNVFFLAMENAIPASLGTILSCPREGISPPYQVEVMGEALMLIPCLAIALLSGVLTKLILKHPLTEVTVQICLHLYSFSSFPFV